jgi:hypothetical protein
MQLYKKLVVKTGTYTTKDGEEKTRWMNVGALMKNDNGLFILMDPVINLAALKEAGNDRVLISCFDPDQGGQKQEGGGNKSSKPVDKPQEDDLPF